MESLMKDPISIPNVCEWCGGAGTSRCGRCHVVYYCSREHQMEDWTNHKKVCKKSVSLVMSPPNVNLPSASSLSCSSAANWNISNVPCSINEEMNRVSLDSNVYNLNNSCIIPEKPMDFSIPNADELFSTFSNDLLSSDNNFWSLIDTCNSQTISDLDLYLGKDPMNEISNLLDQPSSSFIDSTVQNSSVNVVTESISPVNDVNLMECAPLTDICKNVVHDLNKYGICVLDKFIGTKYGRLILDEVKNLYERGIFKKGEIVSPRPYASNESVRSDVTTWVDGTESYCKSIGHLIQKLDLVVTTCNKMSDNGILSKYKLHRRTKAMVACYPGNGTHYKKHIDNPHKDGRCITCIYYLNHNWDVKKHGGLLRMFPSARDSDVAQIAPIFDRMIFFWSDKRNPHEVLPALATRFAITVWYFDADERDAALKAIEQRNLQSQAPVF